jgi:hypothetical protein
MHQPCGGGEMNVGLLLGPTLLGAWPADPTTQLSPSQSSRCVLSNIPQVGEVGPRQGEATTMLNVTDPRAAHARSR